jgi:hypothetical protein
VELVQILRHLITTPNLCIRLYSVCGITSSVTIYLLIYLRKCTCLTCLKFRQRLSSGQTSRLTRDLIYQPHQSPQPSPRKKAAKKMGKAETKAANEYERQRLENIEKNRKLLKYVPSKSSPLTAKGGRSLQRQHRSQTRETSSVH